MLSAAAVVHTAIYLHMKLIVGCSPPRAHGLTGSRVDTTALTPLCQSGVKLFTHHLLFSIAIRLQMFIRYDCELTLKKKSG